MLPSDALSHRRRLAGRVVLAPSRRLLYVTTPKAACTSLLWWLADLEGLTAALRDLPGSTEVDPWLGIHDGLPRLTHGLCFPSGVVDEALASADWFRFALVRNPFTRLFSAWQSKLLLQEPAHQARFGSLDFMTLPLRGPASLALAFEGFLEHLNEAGIQDDYLHHHWAPQADLLRPDLVNYGFVGRFEDPDPLWDRLESRLATGDPSPRSARRVNASPIPFHPRLVTSRAATLIRRLQADDFRLFSYDEDIPAPREDLSASTLTALLTGVELLRGRHARLAQVMAENERLRAIEASTIWRLTAPLRRLATRLRRGAVGASSPSLPASSWETGHRLLLVTHTCHPAGSELLTLALGRLLRGRGLPLAVLALDDGPLAPDFASLGPTLVARGAADPAIPPFLDALVRSGTAAALTSTVVAAPVLPLLRARGLRTVALVHELPGALATPELTQAARTLSRDADAVVFPAELVRRRFLEVAPAPTGFVLVRPQARWRTNPWNERRHEARALVFDELGLPRDSALILGVGTLSPTKGTDRLVDAAPAVLAERPDAVVVFLGDRHGAWGQRLRERVIDEGLDGRVFFPGHRSSPEPWYAAASVFALPSREDSYPSAVLEALDASLRVVAFRGATGAEDLILSRGGFLAEPDDAADLARLLLAALEAPPPPPAAAPEATMDDYADALMALVDEGGSVPRSSR